MTKDTPFPLTSVCGTISSDPEIPSDLQKPRSLMFCKSPLPAWSGRQPGLSSTLTSPATKNNSGASSSLALYLAMIFSAIGWISCLAASDSPSSSESVMGVGGSREKEDKRL